jgi:predicted N-formylglutamate amidohydrolase
MAETVVLLLTCEHGGNRIPPRYRALFRGQRRRLESHRGYDRGALACARAMAARLAAPLFAAETSRLLVDLNRSLHHPALFSAVTRPLPRVVREQILEHHYHPHRRRVERWIASRIKSGRVVTHVAVHSFTPRLNGERRTADIGLLYDPRRALEAGVCAAWKQALKVDGRAARRNYPYRGVSDGLTRHLRGRFPPERYAGIELEINQRLLRRRGLEALRRQLADTLAVAISSLSIRSQSGWARGR